VDFYSGRADHYRWLRSASAAVGGEIQPVEHGQHCRSIGGVAWQPPFPHGPAGIAGVGTDGAVGAGFLYLSVMLDAFSRRIVGWSMASTVATRLVLDPLNMVLMTRQPRGVIHHSDQCSQYTSIELSLNRHYPRQRPRRRWDG